MSCGTSGPSTRASPAQDERAGVDAEVLAVRDEVFALDAAFAADDDRPLAAALLAEDFHLAVDLGDHGRVLGLAGLENLRHAGQTAGDVLGAGHFAGRLGQQRAGRDLAAFHDFDVGLFRQVVNVQRLARLVFEDDLRVQVALGLHDQAAFVAAGILLQPHRLAFDDVFEADLSRDFGQNGDGVRVPLTEQCAGHDLLVLGDGQIRAGGHVVFLQFAALGIEEEDLAVSGEHDILPGVVADDLHAGELDHALLLGLDLALFHVAGGGAADVEGPHRQLRARLADALGGDDAHGHAFFHQRRWKGPCRSTRRRCPARRRRSSGCGPGSSPGPSARCGGQPRA